ncbi:MAG: N-acetylmuramoyl-L-alanine amidase [Deltaproteobacteria bacterium]|nr:N-acetylmuramoyl-L-alanine amidase [Deltaproteobacteria bacterium]
MMLHGPLCRSALLLPLLLGVIPMLGHATAMRDTPEGAYDKGRRCYYDLLASPERQQRRDQWERCIGQFLEIAATFRDRAEGADAQFSAAKTYELLYRASHNPEDLRRAQTEYRLVAQRFRGSRLADDALYRISIIDWEGFHAKEPAMQHLHQLVRRHPKGDMAASAQRALAALEQTPQRFRFAPGLLEIPSTDVARTLREQLSTPPPAHPAMACHVILDPGHGGKDPGARGPGGTMEKTVTLEIAKRVQAVLAHHVPCTISLTRTSDRTVTLDERNSMAGRRQADLFVSIHANAALRPEARGIQTYYLNNASDEASARLAARENASAGKTLSDLEHIVSTMLQNAFTESSQQLAETVHQSLIHRLQRTYDRIADQQVRSALFYVLVGAKSPAILVETSYLSNPEEERRLQSTPYQDAVAEGIADGIAQFWQRHTAQATR